MASVLTIFKWPYGISVAASPPLRSPPLPLPTPPPTHCVPIHRRALQAKGNAAFTSGQFDDAIRYFTEAIDIDATNHVLYSNRSASYASLGRYADALEDAEKVVTLKPDWPKGFSRKGAALQGLRRWDEAIAAYEAGLAVDPSNEQLKLGLADSKKAADAAGKPQTSGLFAQPDVLSRLATDPRTRPLLGQPDFMSMLQEVNRDPNAMSKYLADERFQLALQVSLGLSMDASSSKPAGNGSNQDTNQDADNQNEKGSTKPSTEPEASPEVEMSDVEKDAQKSKEAAYKEKEEGNAAYKKKEFEKAIEHYNRALELYSEDISFLTNRAAVKYEQGDFEGCIADCDEAVDRGRELRTDYKLIARAMTRKGNALVKMGNLEGAIEVYNRSLTEHRNADTLKRLHEAEKALKESKEAAYINLELSLQEKDKGNEAFKLQNYPEAVQHYTEALKRGPPSVNEEAYKLYSNRAACYTKLGAWNEGLKDADECIRLAPAFAKGYSRKGHLQFFMKEYDKAMETYEAGLQHDPENAELKEGLMRCVTAINRMSRGEASEAEIKERQARAMADPEVQQILTDPVMRQVLSDMQEDPAAAQKHLSHPHIAKKIEKLVAAGILQIR